MVPTRTIIQAMTQAYCIGRRKATLWGQTSLIVPCYVGEFGDGLQPIVLQTLAHRPNRYVLLGDSNWGLDNSDPDPFCEHLEEVYEVIESGWGSHYEEWEHDNGRTYTRYRYFPALDATCGAQWWTLHFDL